MSNNKDTSESQSAKSAHPQPVLQAKITAMSDGSVSVNGFPSNLSTALHLITAAHNAVINHFINQAKAGNLDDNNTIIPPKIITSQKPVLIRLDGQPIQ